MTNSQSSGVPHPCREEAPLAKGRKKYQQALEAFNTAREWLLHTEIVLGEEYLAPSSKSKSRAGVDQAFKRHFSWDDQARKDSLSSFNLPREVHKKIKLLYEKSSQDFQANCLDEAKTPDQDRILAASAFRAKTNWISFAPPFFNVSDRRDRARIVVHELYHSWVNMLADADASYEGQKGYPGEYPQAFGNADSYACFVRDVEDVYQRTRR
jgi:Lysine-specific metallo-endopeptidase